MTPTLVREHLSHADPVPPRVDPCARARDWSEIQERMLVPLFETVYERLEVGRATRLLGLRCGSGLALLMAAARGAAVTGVDPSPERLALARERLLPPGGTRARTGTRLVDGTPRDAAGAGTPAYTLVTVFEPVGCLADDSEGLGGLLAGALPLAGHGAAVVLAGWGPPERCATASVLRVAAELADPLHGARRWRPPLRDDLEQVAQRAGLKPDGSGRVACPFGYADVDSAVRGLLSTGLFDAAIAAAGGRQVDKELAEALHPYRREGGTVWMPNVFRYLIARVP
ncbi:class I SAM-dependent methyltransferase [Streptomyces sp. TG1A-8]|uniref:class I SAM-dependent methyltransferase n=1 Tax=Streptomyces sp. TG1A-8 TaxID=3051385 RepID=UPI00265C59E2|nr:class I SAM-dependent methyltransferase [Streptomyces sp. TG1A-8]MDO0925525.1 class I SAM-dependent methyltransferase [Streptomyces sp. TG1A-8]